jgi:hypothetical protein
MKKKDMASSGRGNLRMPTSLKATAVSRPNVTPTPRWQAIWEDDMRKAAVEEKRNLAELITEENKTMMMDQTTMNAFTREWWDLKRMEILQ